MVFGLNDCALDPLTVLAHQSYNNYHQSNTAFVYLIGCITDVSVAVTLFKAAADWARGRNFYTLYGPKGFNTNSGTGPLTHGFQHRPTYGSPDNHDYCLPLLTATGFEGGNEVVSRYLHRSMEIPIKITRWLIRLKSIGDCMWPGLSCCFELNSMQPYNLDCV